MNTESNRGAMSNNRFELISCHSVIIQSSYTMAIKRVAIYSHTKGSICSLPHLIDNRALCDSHTHFVFVFSPYHLHTCIVIVFVFVFFIAHLIHNSAPCDPHTRFPVAWTKKLWILDHVRHFELNSVSFVIFFLKICRFCWTKVFKISWPFVTGQKVSTQYTLDKSCLTLTFHYKLSFFQNPLTPTLTPGHSYPREGQNISSVKKGKKGLTTHPSSPFFYVYVFIFF